MMFKRKIQYAFLVVGGILVSACSSESNAPSCPKVAAASFTPAPTYINLSYETTANANSYKVEHGPTGYTPGTGSSVVTSNPYLQIANLTPSTTYDVYITSICDAQNSSEPYKLSSVTTTPSNCTGTVTMSISQFSPSYISLSFSYSDSSPEKYDVEYGIQGFALGTGTKVSTMTTGNNTLDISPIQPDTNYDIYVRAVCYGNDPSAYVKYQYTSISSCPKPYNLSSYNITGSCNAGSGESRAFSWSYDSAAPISYTFCIVSGTDAPSATGGNSYITSNPSIALSGLYCLWNAFYVRANCSDGSSSQWAGPYYW